MWRVEYKCSCGRIWYRDYNNNQYTSPGICICNSNNIITTRINLREKKLKRILFSK